MNTSEQRPRAGAALRLAFYGDDFTGSTDALEVLAFAGLDCALFLEPTKSKLSGNVKRRLTSGSRSRRFSQWNGPTFDPGCAWMVGEGR